jgi:membrane associated rhomboid family serine protease
MHLLFNMMAMSSFGAVSYAALGAPHFIAAYLNAGVLASLASTVYVAVRLNCIVLSFVIVVCCQL